MMDLFKSNLAVDFDFNLQNSNGKKNAMVIFNLKNDFYQKAMEKLLVETLVKNLDKEFMVEPGYETEIEIISTDNSIEIAIGRSHIRLFFEELSKENINLINRIKSQIEKINTITKIEILDW